MTCNLLNRKFRWQNERKELNFDGNGEPDEKLYHVDEDINVKHNRL